MSDIFHAGISGARGRMGRAVSQVLDAREDVVVATRFDRNIKNFMATIAIAATVIWWLK